MKSNKQNIALLVGAALLLSAPAAYAGNITTSDANKGTTYGGNTYVEGNGTGLGSNGIAVGFGGIQNAATGPLITPPAGTNQTTWWKAGTGTGVLAGEYQEVEPGMASGALWDLAAFVTPADGRLGVISGYNLSSGQNSVVATGSPATRIGDIMIKIGGAAGGFPDPNGNYPATSSNSIYGFDYAVHFNFGSTPATTTYDVYKLTAASVLQNGYYDVQNYNSASQPWRYLSGGVKINAVGNLAGFSRSLTYTNTYSQASALAESGIAMSADYKYYAEISTDFLAADAVLAAMISPSVSYKLTMECGNDSLTGSQSTGFQQVPDGSATLSLLGMSLLAIVAAAKLRMRQVK